MTTNSPYPVDGDVQALIERLNRIAARLKWNNVGYAQDVLKAVDLLTTPPAQLLRPVELPDIEENETAFKAGLNSLVDCLEDCGDAEQGLRLALRSISEKWQEVKS